MSIRTSLFRGLPRLGLAVLCGALLSGCGLLSPDDGASVAEGVTDASGLARLEGKKQTLDLQVSSGLTGERVPDIQLKMLSFGQTRLIYAQDPSGAHLPVAVPLIGEATVRRLIMPPKEPLGYNITTAGASSSGEPLKLDDLEALGTLSEADLQARLRRGPGEAVLLYLYNPVRPLALTGAALDAYTTPINNVTVLKASGEPADASLALLIVSLTRDRYTTWSHLLVDRYLAGRVGQPPTLDLGGDLAFVWSYPVFEVYPPEPTLELGGGDTVTLRVSWRSRNPDPPPPWSFFVSASDDALVSIEPDNFGLQPDSPPQEITLTVNRSGLSTGSHTVTLFIQPFSDTFGLIEQVVERELTFTVAETTPTPESLITITIEPTQPHEGDTLVVSAGGFAPGETVLLDFIGTARTLGDALATADAEGNYRYEIDLSTVPAGSYTLRLTGVQSGASGQMSVEVAAKPPDAVVISDELNLRTGPSYDYPVLEVLVRGDELEVIGTNADDSWIEVVTKTGVQGWVVTDLVELNINLAEVPWNPNVPSPP